MEPPPLWVRLLDWIPRIFILAIVGCAIAMECGLGLDAGPSHRWVSARPLVADVDGDGREDLVGQLRRPGNDELLLAAVSQTKGEVIWEQPIERADEHNAKPRVWIEPVAHLVLLGRGASLTSYQLETGRQQWTRRLSDRVDRIHVAGNDLWVWTVDERTTMLDPSTGDRVAAADPTAKPKRLDHDGPN